MSEEKKNDFEDLVEEYKTINMSGKSLKVKITAKEAGRLNLTMGKTVTDADADKITEILKAMIQRGNAGMKAEQVDAIVAYNYVFLFEESLLLCNPSMTREQLEKAKKEALDKEKKL